MIFRRRRADHLRDAAEQLGLVMDSSTSAAGTVDGVPVVISNPNVYVDRPGGVWMLVGPNAQNWLDNVIPESSTQQMHAVEHADFVGEGTVELGLDLNARTPLPQADAEDIVRVVHAAVAHWRTIS